MSVWYVESSVKIENGDMGYFNLTLHMERSIQKILAQKALCTSGQYETNPFIWFGLKSFIRVW